MVKSMTGFGRAQKMVGGRDISVEIKSVNHRYFEFSSRISRAYGFLEEKMKSYTQGFISRGKVDVAVSIQTIEGSGGQVEINRELAKSYIAALRGLGEETGLTDDLSLCAIARFSDIFAVRKTEEDEEEIWAAVKEVADEAIARPDLLRFPLLRRGVWPHGHPFWRSGLQMRQAGML